MNALTQEEIRLAEVQSHQAHWRRWGPYLSDRQWGTVRKDYSKRRRTSFEHTKRMFEKGRLG